MNALKNLKLLTVVGAASALFGVNAASWAADQPYAEYVAINVVNNNPNVEAKPLLASVRVDINAMASLVPGSAFPNEDWTRIQTYTNLQYAKNAFVKYRLFDKTSKFSLRVFLKVENKGCSVRFFGNTIKEIQVEQTGSDLCKSFSLQSDVKDNTLIYTINYNGL